MSGPRTSTAQEEARLDKARKRQLLLRALWQTWPQFIRSSRMWSLSVAAYGWNARLPTLAESDKLFTAASVASATNRCASPHLRKFLYGALHLDCVVGQSCGSSGGPRHKVLCLLVTGLGLQGPGVARVFLGRGCEKGDGRSSRPGVGFTWSMGLWPWTSACLGLISPWPRSTLYGRAGACGISIGSLRHVSSDMRLMSFCGITRWLSSSVWPIRSAESSSLPPSGRRFGWPVINEARAYNTSVFGHLESMQRAIWVQRHGHGFDPGIVENGH